MTSNGNLPAPDGHGSNESRMPAPVGAGHVTEEPPAGLPQFARVVRKRYRGVLLALLVVPALAAAWVHSQPRQYRATARLQILRSPATAGATDMRSAPGVALNTPAKIARSWALAQKASAHLKSTERATIPPDEISRNLKVSVEEPDVLAISAESGRPDRAALIANAVLDAYVDENHNAAREGVTNTRKFLEEQMPRVMADMKRSEAAIKQFRARYHIRDTASLAEAKTRMALDYGAEADRARAEADAADAELASLRRYLANAKPTRMMKRVISDPVAEGFHDETAKAEVELAKLLTQYDESHPRVVTLRDRLAQLRQSQRERFGTKGGLFKMVDVEEPDPTYEALKERIREQSSRADALRSRATMLGTFSRARQAEVPTSPDAHVELERLQHMRDSTEKSYLNVVSRLEDARLEEVSLLGAVRVVDRARPPHLPFSPKPTFTVALALMLAAMMGLSLALVQESLDTSIQDTDDLMRRAGLAPLGVLPAVNPRAFHAKIAAISPQSALAEGFRMLRTQMAVSGQGSPPATIMVTSAVPGEGKSFVATNLAIAFAQMGARTILVEMDLRRPKLHTAFGISAAPGTADVLAGAAAVESALRKTDVGNLWILARGKEVANPGALLGATELDTFVASLREQADVAILDTPPALAVADAMLLAPHVDASILVVEQGRVRAGMVADARRMLQQVGGRVAGAVLNKTRANGQSYYYEYRNYHSAGATGRKLLAGSGRAGDLAPLPQERGKA